MKISGIILVFKLLIGVSGKENRGKEWEKIIREMFIRDFQK